MRPAALAAAAMLLVPVAAAAQHDAPADHTRPIPVAHAVRAHGTIRLDGSLSEADWATAPPLDAFTQTDPSEGQPATQRTEVRVIYDDDFLYVGARMADDHRPTGRLGRRDMDSGDSDWFKVLIDSYHDHRTAFGFEVNPAGVRRDEIRTIDVDDNSWDPVWDVETHVDSAGWMAEMRIPFSQLRFSGAREQTWGIQFERITGRTQEDVLSTFIPRSERGGVPLFGHLTGVEGIHRGRRFELLPYTLGQTSFVDYGDDPFKNYPDKKARAGLDLLYGIGSNLTLNAAFNPDFGQVEVDPAVVNLGVYETFYEEKRPFFIEGSEIFDFGANGTSGGQIFYSRRIGRPPTLGGPSQFPSDVPDITTILGAGKLSGKVAGWSVGALEAVTSKEEARYRVPFAMTPVRYAILSPSSRDLRYAVEPQTNYFVGRARREWQGGQSLLGGIFTAVNRDLRHDSTDPLTAALHRAAYAGGVDFRREWGNRTWAMFGDGEMSDVQGSTSAITATQRRSNHFFQRPDATHLEVDSSATSLTGYSINLQLQKQSGQHWRGGAGAALTSPRYEVNDLGFSYRTDRRDVQSNIQYVENKPGKRLRRWSANLTGRAERNYAWQRILTFSTLNLNALTPNYNSMVGGVTRYFRSVDDRLTRGGPLATRPAWWSGFAGYGSDGRKPFVGGLTVSGDRYESGGWDWTVTPTLTIKRSARWNLTVSPSVTRAHVVAQYEGSAVDSAHTATYGRDYIFAPLDQTSVDLDARLNVTFTPHLSLETYIQPLLSSADYGAPRDLVAPETYDFEPYPGSLPSPDFNLRSLHGNAVLRWEWRQGSTMYFAWQQFRTDVAGVGNFDFPRDRAALFRTRPDNIFLIKVNYWLSV